MSYIIDGVDFEWTEAEKYWTFAKSYKGDPKQETKNMIFSGDYVGARKIDGAYYRFIKGMNGEMRLQGRSLSVGGEYLDKLDHVPQLHQFFESLPHGTCLLGEIYFPGNEGSNKVTTIMGCLTDKAIARQNVGQKLHYYIFDIWAWGGKSYLGKTAEERVNDLMFYSSVNQSEYVKWAHYYDGEELWNQLQLILGEGGEGIVITKKKSKPEPGKRTARKTLKVKKELQETIDCFFTGRGSAPTRIYSGKDIENWSYWINDVTEERLPEGSHWKEYIIDKTIVPVTKPYYYKWAGSLEIGVIKDGKITSLGWLSGLADEIKANFKSYKERCIEVSAMQFTDETKSALRHAKFIQFRDDLTIYDCTYEKVVHD